METAERERTAQKGKCVLRHTEERGSECHVEENDHRCSVMLGSERKERHMEGLIREDSFSLLKVKNICFLINGYRPMRVGRNT